MCIRDSFEVDTYIPSRHHEGYGLNMNAVRKISEQSDLLITVDCGITSVQEVALARQLGLKIVVTDHHQPGPELPECPVVNPVLNGYPFPSLCGAGTAFKLVCALSGFEAVSYTHLDVYKRQDQLIDIEDLAVQREFSGLKPGQIQQLGHQFGQPLGLRDHHIHIFSLLLRGDGSILHALNIALYAGQRRPQFVGNAGHKALSGFLQIGQILGHLVKGRGQLSLSLIHI